MRNASHGLPKPLVHFRGKPILEHIILGAHQAGINRFVIVVAYGSELIPRWFTNRFRGKVSVSWVENPDYEKQNGISALKASDTGMFLCSPALFDRLQLAAKDGNCSLSEGMRQLAQDRCLRALDIGEVGWQDLDTPEALAYAESTFSAHHTATAVRLAS